MDHLLSALEDVRTPVRLLGLARSALLFVTASRVADNPQPRAVAFHERETNLPALRTKLVEHLRAWQAEGLIAAVHVFTRFESFGGDASEFHDLAHRTAAASRRMLDLMLRPLPAGS